MINEQAMKILLGKEEIREVVGLRYGRGLPFLTDPSPAHPLFRRLCTPK
jgi:hypothetical protein